MKFRRINRSGVFIALAIIFVIASCKNNQNVVNRNPKFQESISKESYKLEDSIKVVLNDNYSGGYEWFFERNDRFTLLKEKDSSFQEGEGELYQNAKIFFLKPMRKGKSTLSFYKKRSFEPDSLMIKDAYTIEILIK